MTRCSSAAPPPLPPRSKPPGEPENCAKSSNDIFWAIINKQPVTPGVLARLNQEVQTAAKHLRLAPANGAFEWHFEDLSDFDGLLWPIARSAADLLVSDQLPFVL